MTIFDTIRATKLSELDLSRHVDVGPDDTASETVARMVETRESCAFVVDDGMLAGLFTQRDAVDKVIGHPETWDQPITGFMTADPKTITAERSVEDGLGVMTEWWVRSVPVLADDGSILGNLSYYTFMRLLAKGISDRTSTGQPQLRHGLALVDLTGLNTSAPVACSPDDTAETVVHHMRARAIGSMLVTDDRDHLVGIITEWDLVSGLGCSVTDLTAVTAADLMSRDPVALSARSSIADAIGQMAERGYSHIPLLGETGRPVGVASFRDVAAYFEATLPALT